MQYKKLNGERVIKIMEKDKHLKGYKFSNLQLNGRNKISV